MTKNKLVQQLIIPLAIISGSLVSSFAIIAYAQTDVIPPSESGITFPIKELGSCTDKESCRKYCDDSANMPSCIAFAKAHGLMNKEEADRAEKFRDNLQKGTGPGGCKSPTECRAFCENVANLETCINFAESHGVKDNQTEDGKKISTYIKSGGKLPGNCTSKETCETYCSDFNNVKECSSFAKNAGLEKREGDNRPSDEQMQKMSEIIAKGETPGGCKNKNECETYCKNDANRDECVTFAEKAGFIKPGEAENIRKSRGNGPGGCTSDATCKAYCADQTHHDECYKFAVDNGFISQEKVNEAKDGFVRLKSGLENAPAEVAQCLTSSLGENIIADIQSGKLTPGQEIGDRVKGCFEKFGQRGDSTEIFKNAPQQIQVCLKEKLGDKLESIKSGNTDATPEVADTFRICSQQFEIQGGDNQDRKNEQGQPQDNNSQNNFQNFLRTAPPEIATCFKEKLGDDFDKVASGTSGSMADIKDRIKPCFEQFRPQEQKLNPTTKEFENNDGENKQFENGQPGQSGQPEKLPEIFRELQKFQQNQQPDSLRQPQPTGNGELPEQFRKFQQLQQKQEQPQQPADGLDRAKFPMPFQSPNMLNEERRLNEIQKASPFSIGGDGASNPTPSGDFLKKVLPGDQLPIQPPTNSFPTDSGIKPTEASPVNQ